MSRLSVMDLTDAAPGTRVKDHEGDLWTKNADGTWHVPGTPHQGWGSGSLSGLDVTLVSRPGGTTPLSHDELAALPCGSRVTPEPGVDAPVWVKGNHGGWNLEGGTGKTISAYFLHKGHRALYLVERGPEPAAPAQLTLEQAFEQYHKSLPQHIPADVPSFRAGWIAAGGAA